MHAKEYSRFLVVDLQTDGRDQARERRAAAGHRGWPPAQWHHGRRARARGPANFEHLSLNEKRREVEKLTAESSRVVARAERGLGTRAAVGDGCGLGGFHTSAS